MASLKLNRWSGQGRACMSRNPFRTLPANIDTIRKEDVEKVTAVLENATIHSMKSLAQSAWSFLLQYSISNFTINVKTIESTSFFIQLLMAIAKFLIRFESNLTLKPFDLEKVLTNIHINLLDSGYDHPELSKDLEFLLSQRLQSYPQFETNSTLLALVLSNMIIYTRIHKNGSIFKEPNNFFATFSKLCKIDEKSALQLFKIMLARWKVIFDETLENEDLKLWQGMCNCQLNFGLVTSIMIPKLFPFYRVNHAETVYQMLCNAYSQQTQKLSILILSICPIKPALTALSDDSFVLGELFYNIQTILKSGKAPPPSDLFCSTKLSFRDFGTEVSWLLFEIQKVFKDLEASSKPLLLHYALVLLKLCSDQPQRIKLSQFFGRAALEMHLFDLAANFADLLISSNEGHKDEAIFKLSYAIGLGFYKVEAYAKCVKFLYLANHYSTSTDLLAEVKRLEIIATAQFKLGEFEQSLSTTTRILEISPKEHSDSSGLLGRWCFLAQKAKSSAWSLKNDVVLANLLRHSILENIRNVAEGLLRLIGKADSRNLQLYYWKHRYYLQKWNDGSIDGLLQESEQLLEISTCPLFTLIFSCFHQIWSFVLGKHVETNDLNLVLETLKLEQFLLNEQVLYIIQSLHSIFLVSGESLLLASVHDLKFVDISRTLDGIIESDWREALEFEKQGMRKAPILLLHKNLSALQRLAASTMNAEVAYSLYLSSRILDHLTKLGQLYRRLGVFKPAKHYLAQARDLASSVCPKSSRHYLIELEIAEVDVLSGNIQNESEVLEVPDRLGLAARRALVLSLLKKDRFEALKNYMKVIQSTRQCVREKIILGLHDLPVPFDMKEDFYLALVCFSNPLECDHPFFYLDDNLNADFQIVLSHTWEAFTYCSPSVFRQFVHKIVRSKSVPLKFALGLLNLSSWAEFKLRSQYDEIEMVKSGVLISSQSEEAVSVLEWPNYVLSFSHNPAGSQDLDLISMSYDPIGHCLFIMVHQTMDSLLLVVPFYGKSFNFSQAMIEIGAVMKENKEILFGKSKDAPKPNYNDPEFKRSWWKVRKQLDQQLADLALKIDQDWIAVLQAILNYASSGCAQNNLPKFKDGLEIFLTGHGPITGQLDDTLAAVLASHGPMPKAKVLDALLGVIQSTFGFIAADRTKALRELRRCYEGSMVEDKHENLFLVQNSTKPSRKAILVLDKHLYLFPWEMTPTFRDFQVYRQPSTWHLAQQLSRRHDVDDQLLENKRPTDNNSVNYILNPSGDLRSTQEYFEGRLGDIDGWAGIVGRPPKEPEFISLISSTDLFLYFGHGGGDAYVSGSRVRRIFYDQDSRCAPSFLIGCSSGRLRDLGEFCPEGTLLNYLRAGSPTVLVNLWDVTDKDIDRFTDVVFEKIGLWPLANIDDAKFELSEAVGQARSVCLLRHLNGAAPVVYGLPFKWPSRRL